MFKIKVGGVSKHHTFFSVPTFSQLCSGTWDKAQQGGRKRWKTGNIKKTGRENKLDKRGERLSRSQRSSGKTEKESNEERKART